MHLRQPPAPRPRRRVPEVWLMIDARLGPGPAAIVARLPPRSAVVVRPYAMHRAGREGTIRAIRRAAGAKRHLLLIAGNGPLAGYDGRHGPGHGADAGFRSWAVHDRREAGQASRARADAILVSPVGPTRSHPGERVLGPRGFMRLARGSTAAAIALGGMDAKLFRYYRRCGAAGWAAIDAWVGPTSVSQKRNCVPT